MRKLFPVALILNLVFAVVSYAENDATFRDLQIKLGTRQAGYFNNKFLSEIPVNEAFKTEVWYPSKLGAFQKHEEVEEVSRSETSSTHFRKIKNPRIISIEKPGKKDLVSLFDNKSTWEHLHIINFKAMRDRVDKELNNLS